MAQKEIDRLLEMVDSTNQQRLQLTELLQSLQEAKSQVGFTKYRVDKRNRLTKKANMPNK
jgi:hypothetical protein